MSFSNLKKSSASSFAKLTQEIEKISNPTGGGGGGDERLWKPELDKSGNGYAVIRFLPAPDGEDIPFAKIWSHAFQGPGGWYIENSLTTLNKKDPVGELNRQLWNSGRDSDKEVARKQKRKLSYYANILVVKDPLHPENDGQVKLYKFGKKIFDKIIEAMQPQFEDETPVNVFDPWSGADFKLKIVKKDGYWNYDKSEFATPSALFGGEDSEIESAWNKQYSLTAFTDDSNFKSYDELNARLTSVLKGRKETPRQDESFEDESEGRGTYNTPEMAVAQAPDWTAEIDSFQQKTVAAAPVKDDDDVMNYFASLASED
ncbi:ssDNA binding protein [Synechococcus phage ACG-2014d]|jgi:hypothetical protein|uniref:Single-stranded DNA-binding protein n=1 Tax=Synechococcus phage ACG-2014d TaxID=1493509 RepID=A0A0E3HVE9_9CAUD|nr:single strand DNA binding protein [Synechococcus phage ACG-2014d]YP_010355170.1 single strand DNA binding protein [Synechococcus phage ACG-2014d]AIX14612.1 ssDNA binding protein [Synechococcus phage ACG-2014d]AIX14832.1 ssDNA binding protein [Synechococcus phage ACG-2014d]AIX15259.1 ssDNA binding protein [Synechococcus phage ACG-2014d]AIX15477.1 ssDNA binding protein [Synechococcus phage ACG-2014d]AIX15906.1 ssDNA binding protein [Synechococcus phage ACG-2014d]